MADFNEASIEPNAAGGDHEMAELIPGPMNGDILEDTPDVPPAEIPVIPLRDVHGYKPGAPVNPFLPQVPVVVKVTAVGDAPLQATASIDGPVQGPRLVITLEHGEFKWTINKYYREVLSLRRELMPLRDKLRGRRNQADSLPRLLHREDLNIRHAGARLKKQVPKVQTFLNAVVSSRTYRSHPATARFFEVSRISFVKDTGPKQKEGLLTKRSGGHRRAVDCLGFTLCCCRFCCWRKRWFVLKDSYLVMIRSHHSSEAQRTISGVLLFDSGMTFNFGLAHTGIRHGIKFSTQSRDLVVKSPSSHKMREWVGALQAVMNSTAKIWVDTKPHYSFAPERSNTPSKWYVDGQGYMSDVADAILAAKDEIFITDWQFSPHIFLKRQGSYKNRLKWRLDYLLLKKAEEGVRVFIQVYDEKLIDLGSKFAQELLKHSNIVFFRHPNFFKSGVLMWAHHEKIVVIDQTLAFVGGIDLAFGRWDNECHEISDSHPSPPEEITREEALTELQEVDEATAYDGNIQEWVGKDFFNPFIKDLVDSHKPFEDLYDRSKDPRMPWHDIASAVYGPAARDVARHFIQRHNFTKREQKEGDEAPYLLPRKTFSESEELETQYLRDILTTGPATANTSAQVLRSLEDWSGGTALEQSIMNAWIKAIKEAEHFIFIEQQFFISSLLKEKITNGVAEALRLRIARAYREKETFRVIIVMPLLPSFPAEKYGTQATAILEAVLHWNYYTLSRGEDSLFGRLHHEDGIPEDEIKNYISAYGLRTHGEINGTPDSEIVYVHSKLMIVDDRITIIGSANVNDRSMTGERDSEVAVRFEDTEMIDGTMNGQPFKVGKFSHSLRVHLFKEHLGLLPVQQKAEVQSPATDISVEDPASDDFYLNTWMKCAQNNTQLYKQVFGGDILPADETCSYKKLEKFKTHSGVVDSDVERARETLKKIQGHVVELPLHFLEDENLTPDLHYIINFAPDCLVQ